jgi:tetratricopeptide (TPR) repeat protein
MSGRYPPGHGARHNGMRMDPATPTLADTLARAGLATAAFVAAFPLDKRFGLNKGFQTYSDRMPRGAGGRLASERPGEQVATDAIDWLTKNRTRRFFLWVHFFEPHAPYGNPSSQTPATQRYDEEVTEADRQAGRVIEALGADSANTMIVMAADHGEAFGEHGEIGHSIFVYDTTLRVPMVMAGPGVASNTTVATPISLIDVAPTVLARLGVQGFDADGVNVLTGRGAPPERDLYAESFAPLLDFGWSPLRAWRSQNWKYIAAPRAELYDLTKDPEETTDLASSDSARVKTMSERVARISSAELPNRGTLEPDAAARLQALGYTSGGRRTSVGRPDPKDRVALARQIAQVTSGELQGAALERALREILTADADNPQAHLRLGYVLLESNRCAEARRHFAAALAARIPTADAHLGLAACDTLARRFDAAAATLRDAERIEPDNPVVLANLGIVLSDGGKPADAVPVLERALTLDPDLHEARFNLAVAFGRLGRRADAAVHAQELLRRLPIDAPQRAEVERLLNAVR